MTRRTTDMQKKQRLKLAMVLITLLFFAAIGYIWCLKITKGAIYEQRALRQYTNRYDVQLYPMRGTIVDRNMKEMATSVPIYNVIFDAVVLNENSRNEEKRLANINNTLKALDEMFESLTMETLMDYMKTDEEGQLINPSSYIKLVEGISSEQADALRSLELPGVWLEDDSKRVYPYDKLAANIIGFIRGDSSWGIENYYNDSLTGEAGRAFITYNDSATPVINKIPAKNGYKVITTLDLELQQYAEDALQEAVEMYQPQNGTIIAMDPRSGEILAMALYPSFNPNSPMDPIYMDDAQFKQKWESMTEEEQMDERYREWKNYCISSVFEPGSIFKPIVVAAALDEGVISLNETFYCSGQKVLYDEPLNCHLLSGHGTQTVEDVLANSCNVAMMDIAAKMGSDLFYKHFRDFGFGEKTEIDLLGEESAKDQVFSKSDFANPVQLATSSFGQGSTCTAIQAINAFAAVINGGSVMKPYIVSQVIDENGNVVIDNKATEVRKILSTETSDTLRVMMKSVVDWGTGKKAKIPGYSIGGKTGTAQQGVRDKKEHTLTFIGYLPVEDPQLVALALLDKPVDSDSQGSATAAPLLKNFLEKAIMYMGIKPSNEEEVSEDLFVSVDSVTVADYTGMSMADATQIILSEGLQYEASGDGNGVAGQWPKSGTKVDRGTTIALYTKVDENIEDTVAVPSVIGMTYDEALKTLIDSSFTAVVSTGDTKNKVVSEQYPPPKQHLPAQSDVELIFTEAEANESR